MICQNLTLKNQDYHWEINTVHTGTCITQVLNSCTYPASILAPCFCPDTDWWALSVIAVATDMNLKQKTKQKIKKNIPSALFTCTLKSNEKVIIWYMFRYHNTIFWLCVNNFILTLQTLCFWASSGMREDSFCHLLRRPPLRLAAGDTASCGPHECPHT